MSARHVALGLVAVGVLAACGMPVANNAQGSAERTSELSSPIDVLSDSELARGLDTSIDVSVQPFDVDPNLDVTGVMPDVWLATDGRPSGSEAAVTQVSVVFRPNGVWSDLHWDFELGPDGQVRQASGPTGPVTRCCPVPTVGVDEALVRLARQQTPLPVAVEPGATYPVPIDPMEALPQPRATITAVEPSLTSLWDVDGKHWLVPAYLFSGEQISSTVAAIDAVSIRLIDPPTIPPPPALPTSMPIVTVASTTTTTPPPSTTFPTPTTAQP